MLKKITKLIIAMLLAAAFVGCQAEQTGSETTNNNNKITSLQTVINNADDGDVIDLSESKYSSITSYSATINKTVTINGSSTNLKNATITVNSDNVSISGITNASVTASSSLNNGSLRISSSSLKNLTINGGGINSIVIIDVSVDAVTIDKVMSAADAQYVRFCVDAATKIGGMNISSSTLIDVTGDTTSSRPDANNYNITFGNENICVAFNNKMDLTTPDGKAKASFGGDNSSDADFFIIVNQGKPIIKKFFDQVANKICDKDFNPYMEGSESQFDFNQPINRDTHFIGKPDSITAEGNIVIGEGQLYIEMQQHDESGYANGDTWTFDLTSDKDVDLSGYRFTWSYRLSSGSHVIASSDSMNGYCEFTGNPISTTAEFKIGRDADLAPLPNDGLYQLSIEVELTSTDQRIHYVAGTFDLEILL